MFREEAIQQSRAKLTGNVTIAMPISWNAIGYLLFSGLFVTLAFLSLASYSRVENANGSLTPDKGVSTVFPSRNGTFVTLAVSEGDSVEAGDLLAEIRTEEDSGQGSSSAEQIERAILLQDTSLASQLEAANAAAIAQQAQLAARQAGLRSEIEEIRSQVMMQEGLITAARTDFERAKQVAEKGFLSRRDLEQRAEVVLSRQQALSQLQQTLSAKRAAVAEAERSASQIAAQARAQSADLASARAQVSQQAANNRGSRSYALRAPVAGRVTALTAKVGQRADPQSAALAIVPDGAELMAELYVPSSAIGFVKEGQEVKLAIDAFPYQRFGTVKGEVFTVASTSIREQGPGGAVETVYPVRVRLRTDKVDAFGRQESLLSGMACSARIVTEKLSLLEWLFEPLFAVSQR